MPGLNLDQIIRRYIFKLFVVFLVSYTEVLRYNLGASKTAFSQFVFQFIIYQPTYLPALHSVSYGGSHKIKSE
jgi:hypothetical protein